MYDQVRLTNYSLVSLCFISFEDFNSGDCQISVKKSAAVRPRSFFEFLLQSSAMKKTSIKSIAFIIDGNRRWAKERGGGAAYGHAKGVENVFDILAVSHELGINDVCFYVFSTENWKRSKEEVDNLMHLFAYHIESELPQFHEKKVRFRVAGKRDMFSKKLQNLIERAEKETQKYKKTIWLCASYGGRLEIVEAAKQMQGKRITEESFEKALWTSDLPDPDLIVRTGGNHRLSNFLMWKSAYSELYFTKTKWPAFRKRHLLKILDWYNKNIQVNKGK